MPCAGTETRSAGLHGAHGYSPSLGLDQWPNAVHFHWSSLPAVSHFTAHWVVVLRDRRRSPDVHLSIDRCHARKRSMPFQAQQLLRSEFPCEFLSAIRPRELHSTARRSERREPPGSAAERSGDQHAKGGRGPLSVQIENRRVRQAGSHLRPICIGVSYEHTSLSSHDRTGR